MKTNALAALQALFARFWPALGRAARLLPLLLLLTPPAAVQAQFNYKTDNRQITITGYTGPGGAVDIPSTINGLPVIFWATNVSVVVEACTDLANPRWFPVGTRILTGGSSYFRGPQWTNYSTRFHRVISPVPQKSKSIP